MADVGGPSFHSQKLSIEGVIVSIEEYKEARLSETALKDELAVLIRLESAKSDDRKRPSNIIDVLLRGEWARACSFVCVGDDMSIQRFEAKQQQQQGEPTSLSDIAANARKRSAFFLLEPNASTEITVVRKKTVLVNAASLGCLISSAELTQKEKVATASPFAPIDINHFGAMHRYYDAVFGNKNLFSKRGAFVERVVGRRTAILDAGCGTGLFAFYLRNVGCRPALLDASASMEKIVQAQNDFYAVAEDDPFHRHSLPFYRADVSSFSLAQMSGKGVEEYVVFEVVLCLDVLQYLPTVDRVRSALLCLALHLAAGGSMLISIVNADNANSPRERARAPADRH